MPFPYPRHVVHRCDKLIWVKKKLHKNIGCLKTTQSESLNREGKERLRYPKKGLQRQHGVLKFQ